ncbi:hypothetical protein RJ641_033799 [Dillenia turbinata]|uniref:Uncharacterized protein n=1 Tax=Dillenia turbinata TaxID=194707 RepID=A0AAN8VRZ0_9MAGN
MERKPKYHPFEEISSFNSTESGDARLTPAETSRPMIEVNSKATLMFFGLINDEVQENLALYIYFQVNNDEGLMKIPTSENNFVKVIIGLDMMEMLSELEVSGPGEIEFGIEELEDEDEDVDDGNDEDDGDDENYDEAKIHSWLQILWHKQHCCSHFLFFECIVSVGLCCHS